MHNANSLTRLYFSGEIAAHGQCQLSPEQIHHILHVLRLVPGDHVTLFDGRGSEYAAVITRMDKNGATLNVGDARHVDRESSLQVTLVQGVSSGERMDYTVQKAVELGVAAIQPLTMARSVVRLAGARAERRTAHWQSVAVAACEQCGRNILPIMHPLQTLTDWLAAPAGEALRILLSPHAGRNLRDLSCPATKVMLLAGPEGGFVPEEERLATSAGFVPLRLGPRVLRTETAAVAALAAMQALWGDF